MIRILLIAAVAMVTTPAHASTEFQGAFIPVDNEGPTNAELFRSTDSAVYPPAGGDETGYANLGRWIHRNSSHGYASFAGDAGAAEIEINAVPTEVMGGDTVVFMTQDQREIFVHLRGITGTSEAAINKLVRLINEKPVICRNLDAKCDESAIGDCWALPDYATHGLTLSQRMQKSGLVSVSTVWSTKDYCSP